MATGEPREPIEEAREPSEEELRAAYEAQVKRLRVEHVVLETVVTLANLGMRGQDGATVTRLSAFAQSTGYLISIPVPILVGALYQHSGGWRTPLALMAVLMVLQLVAGLVAGRDRRIG